MARRMSPADLNFPNYDDAIPDIAGFKDESHKPDGCPSLASSRLDMKLYLDFKDPTKSLFVQDRLDGERKRFLLTNYNDSLPEPIIETDDLDAVLLEIEAIRNDRKGGGAGISSPKPYQVEFPDFPDTLPELDGFMDVSDRSGSCPTFSNEELKIDLYFGYPGQNLSGITDDDGIADDDEQAETTGSEKKTGPTRYLAIEADESGHKTDVRLDTNNIDEILDFIDRKRAEYVPAPKM